ncbi:MAG: ferredoxin family protein [Coprothermobacterota bacterium]|nr:ferredoxin family protein [Coprothermobacterota bacterium]
MQKDRSTYTGLPRNEIDWFPRIDQEKCKPDECNFHCVTFCFFGVFSHKGNEVAEVSKPYECNVGDESCKFQCPLDAISFPAREELKEMLRKVRAKYQNKEA